MRRAAKTDTAQSGILARFEAKFIKSDGCWNWTASKHPKGHGLFAMRTTAKSGITVASRVSWILYRGEIPAGQVVCHRCDNPGCVNPDHLFLGTKGDNNRDRHAKGRTSNAKSLAIAHQNYRDRTHCVHGHEFTPENTRICKRGWRSCRTCQRIRP